MAESIQYRLTLPPGAVAPVNVIRRVGSEDIEIPNTILSCYESGLVIEGEISPKIRGLLAEAGVKIKLLNDPNGAHQNGADRPPDIDEMFATLGSAPEGPIRLDPNDVFFQNGA